jgi:hypothetical protein
LLTVRGISVNRPLHEFALGVELSASFEAQP